MPDTTVQMIAPDGKTVGDVPVANQAAALAKGFTLAPTAQPQDDKSFVPWNTIPPEIQEITHEGQTPLIHVQSGKMGDVPMDNAPAAIKTGEFRLPTQEELHQTIDEEN